MFEATASEFPFVDRLPKREKGKVAQLLDQVAEFAELQKKHGALVPITVVRGLLNISKQRVHQLREAGAFQGIKFHGHYYVPEAELVEFLKRERKSGGQFKPPTFKECLERSHELVKESSK
jgi:hypothetical protein